MAADSGTLATYVGANTDDTAFVADTWGQAVALVTRYIGDAIVPEPVLDLAKLNVGSELYARRNAPSGITQFATTGDASPIRLARDPMTSVYPILGPYVGLGVA